MKRYTDRLKDSRGKTGIDDAITVGYGTINGVNAVIAALISASWADRWDVLLVTAFSRRRKLHSNARQL